MSNVAIEVQGLEKIYESYHKKPGFWGGFKSLFWRDKIFIPAVKKISFSVQKGELVGFLGSNGAGKTTTLKMLSGLLQPTSGRAKVLGYTPIKRQDEFKKRFSLVMGQKSQLWWDLPAMDTFLMQKEIYQRSTEDFKKNLADLLELLSLSQSIIHKPVRQLSLGERMKCELVAALLHQPEILFLDEPSIGLDVHAQKAVRDFIRTYNQEFVTTIVLTSHYMEDIKELCQRVIVIDQGQILFDGQLQDIIQQYAINKKITLTFQTPVSKEKLQTYGKILSYEKQAASLEIPRPTSTKIAAQLLSQLPVDDFTIEEEKIEEIIRQLLGDRHERS